MKSRLLNDATANKCSRANTAALIGSVFKQIVNPFAVGSVLFFAILLSACQSFDAPKPVIKYPGFVVTIKEDPTLTTLGMSHNRVGLGICEIILREYPVCLLHEIRHCIEGHWHEGRESDDDCY